MICQLLSVVQLGSSGAAPLTSALSNVNSWPFIERILQNHLVLRTVVGKVFTMASKEGSSEIPSCAFCEIISANDSNKLIFQVLTYVFIEKL